MTNAANYTGLAAQLPPLLQSMPKTQAEWQLFLQQMNVWQQQLLALATLSQAGFTGTITTAKLSVATGSMTFQNGVLTSETAAT